MRRISWQFWLIAAAVVAAYVVAGFWFNHSAPANLMYDIGTVGTCVAAVLFIAVYTILGLRGPAKWWRNDVGTCLVLAVGSMLPHMGPLAWAVIFNHGMLIAPWPVWIELGGTFLSGLMILAMALLWLSSPRSRTGNGGG